MNECIYAEHVLNILYFYWIIIIINVKAENATHFDILNNN